MRSSWYLWLPCATILVLVGGLVAFDIPANSDHLDESYEPLKTLKFVHSRGRAFHEWPPLPNFLYAPAFAGPLLYWKMTGDLGRVSTDYPYGFARPFEQQGALIVVARALGLAIGLASVALTARSLRGLAGSATASFLAVFLCMATSPELIFKFVATKPDGLMVAFLALAMATYADIMASGLTPRRGALLSCFPVASISCKELTAPAFVLPYLILAAVGWSRTKGDRAGRRAFLRAYGVAIATGLAAYFAINVVYAPSTWLDRMRV